MAGDFFGELVQGAFGLIAADQAKSEAERNRSAQREAAQSSIQWRVADAQAAGVHPLFALGASPASFSPVHSGAPEAFARSGQSFGRAISAAMAEDQKEVKEAQLEQVRAQTAKDLAQAQYYDSLSFRTLTEDQPARPLTLGMTVPSFLDNRGDIWTDTSPVGTSVRERAVKKGPGAPTGDFTFEPRKITSASGGDPSVVAGPPGAFWQPWTVGVQSGSMGTEFGRSDYDRHLLIVLPTSGANASEAIEAISEGGGRSPVGAAIWAENVRRYGAEYMHALRDRLRGSSGRPVADQLKDQIRGFFAEWRRRKQAARPGGR